MDEFDDLKEPVCHIQEDQFPMQGTCMAVTGAGIFKEYRQYCPHCQVLALPPDGGTLAMAVVFECEKCGYWNRIRRGKE